MSETEKLERGLGLAEATSLNMTFMVGIGPFIVIPFVVQAMHGPQCLLAWVVGAMLALFDGCIWAELGAAMPEAGGSYVFLRQAYGPGRWGRLMSFLFIWQTLFQGPLSIASGALGFAGYSTYFTRGTRIAGWFGGHTEQAIGGAIVLLVVALLYRRIRTIGKISVVLCAIVVGTILWLIYGGVTHFHADQVFVYPKGAWNLSWLFMAGLGHATVQSVYSYLGYYNVCNLGGEMKNPTRNIPRAIFISIIAIAALYFAMQTTILSVVPWQEAEKTKAVVSLFVERTFGAHWAALATGLILVSAFGSIFAAMLGYSRVPYAAALDGNYFRAFARVHPVHQFPYVSLLALAGVAALFCFLRLADLIAALVVIRIILQFLVQSIGVIVLRIRRPEMARPFRMWLYPVPALVAAGSFVFILVSRRGFLREIRYAAVILVVGIVVYCVRAWRRREWPFGGASLVAGR